MVSERSVLRVFRGQSVSERSVLRVFRGQSVSEWSVLRVFRGQLVSEWSVLRVFRGQLVISALRLTRGAAVVVTATPLLDDACDLISSNGSTFPRLDNIPAMISDGQLTSTDLKAASLPPDEYTNIRVIYLYRRRRPFINQK